MQPVPDLAALTLHDMSLIRLVIDWRDGLCTADIRGAVVPNAAGAWLRWTGVTGVEMPRGLPWGPSESILEAKGPIEGRYELLMQSGDLVVVRAARCEIEFEPPAV